MKTCFLTMVCLVFFWCGESAASAQKRTRQAAPTASCKAESIVFRCPKGLKPLSLETEGTLLFLFQAKDHYGVFVANPGDGLKGDELATKIIKSALPKMFPKEAQTFELKSFDITWDKTKISKYQESQAGLQAFNGNLLVLTRYYLLKVKEKSIFVGYVSEFGKGEEAKEDFERGLGGVAMTACYSLRDSVYSITGETIRRDGDPCELVQNIDEAPH